MGRGPAVPIPLIAPRSIHEVQASRQDERDLPNQLADFDGARPRQ